MTDFKCSTCSKAFKRKGDCTRHERLHTGIKPYVCEKCGRAFSQQCGLRTHRNVHTKMKPFKCGVRGCEAAFGDPSSRFRHRQEAHFFIGKYYCPEPNCSSSIKRRSAFVAHLRKHGMSPSKALVDSLHFFPPEQNDTDVNACGNGTLASNEKNYPPKEPVNIFDGLSTPASMLDNFQDDSWLFTFDDHRGARPYDVSQTSDSVSPLSTILSTPPLPEPSYSSDGAPFFDSQAPQFTQSDFLDKLFWSNPDGTELLGWNIGCLLRGVEA